MTPLQTVQTHYRFPDYIIPHPLQVEAINDTADLPNSGQWHCMGTGKTFIATAIGLYHKVMWGHRLVIIMPPILLRQWGRWLAEIQPTLTVAEYRGTPSKRAAINLEVDILLVGIQIFKKEFDRFSAYFEYKLYTVIVDEATMLGNIESDMHRKVYQFGIGRPQIMLTGTPMNSVMDAYALIKFSSPGTYYNVNHFHNLHVKFVDSFRKPVEFQNLELLSSNLMINSKRILFEDMYPASDPPLYDPIYYELELNHYALYERLAREALLKLPEDDKIDYLTTQRLTHALGQIVVNLGHFSGKQDAVSNAIRLIDEKLGELGEGKLVIFANYKKSVAAVIQHFSRFGAMAINSEVTEAQKQASIERFKTDPKCRILVAQFKSGGYGLDGLQHVCNHCIFIEPCQQPRDFHQAVARLKRTGQSRRVVVYLAIAERTLQVRSFNNLLCNDSLVNRVVRSVTDLREFIFGN
jgi:SNF2 family DNA or RNA helicase